MFMYTLFAILLSCSSSKNLDTAISEITPPFEVESPKELVLIPERPQDMSISKDGSFFISSQTGDYLYRLQKTIDEIEVLYDQNTIDPQDIREEQTGDFRNILALEHIENDLFFTTTDFGVEGTLSWVESYNGISYQTQTLHSASVEGTLIRNPIDLQRPLEDMTLFSQQLWIADNEARALFSYEDNQLTVHSAGQERPETICFGSVNNKEVIFIGGEEGIWYKEGTDGLPIQISNIPALSLTYLPEHMELWIGNSTGILVLDVSKELSLFQIEDAYQLSSINSRVSRLIHRNNFIFFTDGIGEYVFVAKIIRNDIN